MIFAQKAQNEESATMGEEETKVRVLTNNDIDVSISKFI